MYSAGSVCVGPGVPIPTGEAVATGAVVWGATGVVTGLAVGTGVAGGVAFWVHPAVNTNATTSTRLNTKISKSSYQYIV